MQKPISPLARMITGEIQNQLKASRSLDSKKKVKVLGAETESRCNLKYFTYYSIG